MPGSTPATASEATRSSHGALTRGEIAERVREIVAAGVRRVSVGTTITQAAYTLAERSAIDLLTTGGYTELEAALDFGTMNSLFTSPR